VRLVLYPEQPLSDLKRVTPYWYIATPYTKYRDGHEAAFIAACQVTAALIRVGQPVFSPIAHSHVIAIHGDLSLTDHDVWLTADRPLMDAAGGILVVMLDGWEDSIGVKHEIEVFKQAGKPIEYLMPME
jgi:hypothetical protein